MYYTEVCKGLGFFYMKHINKVYTVLFVVLITSTLFVNIKASISAYIDFYFPNESTEKKEENLFYSGLSFLEHPSIATFLSYTGLDTSFGFFAPNVASEYITEFNFYTADSTYLATSYNPKMHQKESISRVRTAYSMFENYMDKKTDSLEIKKADIFLKGLASKALKEQDSAFYVNVMVSLYHYPTLKQLDRFKDMEPKFIVLKSKSYNRNEIWQHFE